MDVNPTNLRTAGVAFKKTYMLGFASHTTLWARIATKVNSTTSSNEYGWLGDFPQVREWIGEREYRSIAQHDYTIKNRKFESTVTVKREHFEDDNLGIIGPIMQGMGESVARHPDELLFEVLELGYIQNCFDGQPFFDGDHPVKNDDGSERSVANYYPGNKPHWYLLDTSRALKPLIRQVRKEPEFVSKTDVIPTVPIIDSCFFVSLWCYL